MCLQGHGRNESHYHKAEVEWRCSTHGCPAIWEIEEKVDYIILKASPILPHFIKKLAVKYLLSLHSSLWFYEAIKSNGNLYIFFFIGGGGNTDISESAQYVNLYGCWLASLCVHCKKKGYIMSINVLLGENRWGQLHHRCSLWHLWLRLSRWGRSSINHAAGGSILPPVWIHLCEICLTERQIIKRFLH